MIIAPNTPEENCQDKTFGEDKTHVVREFRKTNATIDEILTYFENKTQGQRLAKRSDVNPSDLTIHLPQIAILSAIYDDEGAVNDIEFDLLGTKVVLFYGEITGTRVSKHSSKQISQRAINSARQCVALREPIIVTSKTLSEEHSYLSVTVLYIPLSQDGELIERLFAYIKVAHHSNLMPSPKKHISPFK